MSVTFPTKPSTNVRYNRAMQLISTTFRIQSPRPVRLGKPAGQALAAYFLTGGRLLRWRSYSSTESR